MNWHIVAVGRTAKRLLKYFGLYYLLVCLFTVAGVMWLIEEFPHRISGILKKFLVGWIVAPFTWVWEKFWDQIFGRAREAIGKYLVKPYYPKAFYWTGKGLVRTIWRRNKQKKESEAEKALNDATWQTTMAGHDLAYVEAGQGAIKQLFDAGADIVVLLNPVFGPKKVARFTVAGNKIKVDSLLSIFNSLESGWYADPPGEKIFSSSMSNSNLKMKEVVKIVCQNL